MKAIVTGSFDPITIGHIDLIKKASKEYDTVYVVALVNSSKKSMFSLDERKEIMVLSLSDIENVIVDAYDGLTVDYMHLHGIKNIIRCIRTESDRVYEQELAKAMKEYDSDFNTVFIQANERLAEISSTKVRELLSNDKPIDNYVHKNALSTILRFYK